MLSDILVDDDRFRQTLDDAISKGEIESFPAYAKETDSTRQKAKDSERKSRESFDKRVAAKEAKAAMANDKKGGKSKSKKSGGDMADLAALIQARQKSRAGGFFDHLETKYAPKPRGSKRATPMEEPSEEAFQEMADRAKKRKQNSRAKVAVSDGEDEEMGFGEEDIGDSGEDEDEEEDEAPRKPKARAKAHKGRGRVSSRGL
jgi:DnaJ family protein C protein 9